MTCEKFKMCQMTHEMPFIIIIIVVGGGGGKVAL